MGGWRKDFAKGSAALMTSSIPIAFMGSLKSFP